MRIDVHVGAVEHELLGADQFVERIGDAVVVQVARRRVLLRAEDPRRPRVDQRRQLGQVDRAHVHDEIIVPTRQAILVFSRTANGNVAPLRIITGPKTNMFRARGIAVDPINNIIAMGNANPQGILIFNRTDDGDVAPRSIITGPRTGIYALKGFAVLPDRKELIATVEARGVQVSRNVGESFVGIWNYTDNGDVAPKAIIKGETTMLIAPRGAALDFKHQEIFIIDKVQNSFFTYSWQKILQTMQR